MTAAPRQRLLLTGPLRDRAPWRAAAEGAGWEVLERPLLEARPVDFDWPDPDPDGIVVTSSSALEALGRHLERARSLPLGIVGDASAERARAAGFAVVCVAPLDAARLARSLPEAFPAGARLLWPHGDRSAAAGERFRRSGFAVEARLAYRTVRIEDPAPLPAAEALLLTSPSGVEAALDLGLAAHSARLLCLGAATAEAVERLLDRPVEPLARPEPGALADRLRGLRPPGR